MAYTNVSPVGLLLAERMAPWLTDSLAMYLDSIGSMLDPLYALAIDQGSDGDPDYVPAWGSLFDPTLCETDDLPYLGQFVGVGIPTGADDAHARALVTAEAGKNRGTPVSIQSAVQRSISTPWTPSTAVLSGVLLTYPTDPAVAPIYYKTTTGFTTPATFNTTNLTAIDPTTQYSILERTNGVTGATNKGYQLTVVVRPEQLTPASNSAAVLAAANAVKPGGIVLTVIQSDSPLWSAATLAWNAVAGTVQWGSVAPGQV